MITLKQFTQYLTEAVAGKHGVMAFGRMNPPTTGHQLVVNKVHELADKHNADHRVVLSHSQDSKKNPLSIEQKIKHAKRAFPGTEIHGASREAPTIMHHAAAMHKAGVKHLHVVAGSDRVDEYHKLLHKYNDKASAHGHYNFKSITVHSSGERDPDSDSDTGMSASKMRSHVASGNRAEFHKGVPKSMSKKHADEMYDDLHKGMHSGLNESFSEFSNKFKSKATQAGDVHKHSVAFDSPEVAKEHHTKIHAYLTSVGFKKDSPTSYYHPKTKHMVDLKQSGNKVNAVYYA